MRTLQRIAPVLLPLVMALGPVPDLGAAEPVQQPVSKVNINKATTAELQQVKGIGPSLARRIIEYREQHGPFRKVEEIMNVRGIGEKTFLRFRDRITVGESTSRQD